MPQTEKTQEELKKEYKETPPKEVVLIIPHPVGSSLLQHISDYLQKEYHFDTPPEKDYEGYGQLFYNSSLRSIMGSVLEWDSEQITCVINTESYRSGGGCWQEYWEKLLEASEITEWG